MLNGHISHLTAVSSAVTGCTDVDCPGAISRRGHEVGAAALEVEVLPVKSAVVGSTPGHAGGRAQRHPDAPQQTTTDHRGGLGVWKGGGGSE